MTFQRKVGLAGYELLHDRNLDKRINGFYRIHMATPVPFAEGYPEYPEQTGERSEIIDFYFFLGEELRKNRKSAEISILYKTGKSSLFAG